MSGDILMSSNRERLANIRDRAQRIVEGVRADDDIPSSQVRKLEHLLTIVDHTCEIAEKHPAPDEMLDGLDEELEEFEQRFEEYEQKWAEP